MKQFGKIISVAIVGVTLCATSAVEATNRGKHIVGGFGSHHRGGHYVSRHSNSNRGMHIVGGHGRHHKGGHMVG